MTRINNICEHCKGRISYVTLVDRYNNGVETIHLSSEKEGISSEKWTNISGTSWEENRYVCPCCGNIINTTEIKIEYASDKKPIGVRVPELGNSTKVLLKEFTEKELKRLLKIKQEEEDIKKEIALSEKLYARGYSGYRDSHSRSRNDNREFIVKCPKCRTKASMFPEEESIKCPNCAFKITLNNSIETMVINN